MNKKEKPSLQLTKTRADFDNDHREAVQEIHETRDRLGQFSLRYMMEAVLGDDYTKMVLGEQGGNIAMKDVRLSVKRSDDGGLATQLDGAQLKAILQEAHPHLDDFAINEMAKLAPQGEKKREMLEALDKQEEAAATDAFITYLAGLEPTERNTILDFIKRMGAAKLK